MNPRQTRTRPAEITVPESAKTVTPPEGTIENGIETAVIAGAATMMTEVLDGNCLTNGLDAVTESALTVTANVAPKEEIEGAARRPREGGNPLLT